jgi:hypothetical protein
VLNTPEPGGEARKEREALSGLVLGRAGREGEARPLVRTDGHPGVPAPVALVDVPGRLARHSARFLQPR